MQPNAAEPTGRLRDQPAEQQESLIWQEFRSSAAARGLSARMAISDQPLEARLRAYESANRYDRPRDALHLVLICCREPIGANSILTLELISGLQLAQDLPNGESSSAVNPPHRQPHPFGLRASLPRCHRDDSAWFPQGGGSREIATDPTVHNPTECNLFDCPQPTPVSSEPAQILEDRIVKVWGCAPLLLHPTWRSVFPLSFFIVQSCWISTEARRLASSRQRTPRETLEPALHSFVSSPGELQQQERIALHSTASAWERKSGNIQRALLSSCRLHKTQENSPVSRYFPCENCQHALRGLGCGPDPGVQHAVCGCHRRGDPDVGVLEPRREALIPIRTGDELDDRR